MNLATGEEEYRPEADLHVYNPHGPSIHWSRIYNSLRNSDGTYEEDDFGGCWSTPYNVGVYDPSTPMDKQLVAGGSSVSLSLGGHDAPGTGLTWDIVRNGSTIATSSSTAGWAVSNGGISIANVTAPSGATSATLYEIRAKYGAMGSNASGFFDVRTATQCPVGGSSTLAITGSDLPSTTTWDVVQAGVVVGSDAAPHGWSATVNAGTPPTLGVSPPILASIATNYEVRYHYTTGGLSATFSTIAHRFQPSSGTKYVLFPNGARVSFSSAAVPTSGSPAVSCTVQAGYAMLVEWDYSSTDALGTYKITFHDRSQWITTTPGIAIGGGAVCSFLAQQKDAVGNTLAFNYATNPLPIDGFPLLSTIVDSSTSTTLLTINRATDGTGNILSVSDCYGRSIYYHEGTYNTVNVPTGFPQSWQEVDQVSQVVTTGTSSPPLRWSYGYTDVANGESTEQVPFMTSITVPSPTGVGNATATINYAGTTGYVTSLVDGNGNKDLISFPDSSHAQVTIQNPSSVTAYSYQVGFDLNMNQTTITDGAGTVVLTAAYSDPNTPYQPSSVTDANGKQWDFTWDGLGNLKTSTTPRSTQTTYTWSFTNFALGELTSVQQGTKTATTATYYEPSGLLHTLNTPAPGTSGGGTVTTTLSWTSLGNIASVVTPGNNAVTSMTTTYGYTTDGSYSQNEALSEPITVTDNLSKVTHLRYDSRSNRTEVIDAVGNETDTAYNLADQRTTTTYPLTGMTGAGHATGVYAYLYPGGPPITWTAFNESGTQVRQVSFGFGPEGEPLSRTGSAEAAALAYDAAYRLISLADGSSHSTAWHYNSAGYPDKVTFPGGDNVQYTSYDAVGHLKQRVDGRGVTTNYSYTDAASALTNISYPASTGINVTLTWDSYDRLSTASDGAGSYSFNYDDRDVLTSQSTTYSGLAAKTTSYGFYNDGSRETLTTPAGTFTSSYNGRGELTGLSNPYSESFSWTYLDNGWLKTQGLPASVTSTWTYDSWGEPTDLTTKLGSSVLSEYGSATYDGVGNTASVTATVSGVSSYGGLTRYTYDTKDELTQESSARNGGYTYGFGYDGAGNPTTFKGVGHTFNSDNQDSGNTYDNEGNPTTYKGTSMSWDAEDRLTGVGSTWTAGYQFTGLRAWKNNAGTKTYFLYDGITPVVELDASGNVLAANTFGAAGLLARRASGSTSFYTFDLQGNVAQRLGSTGGVQASFYFDVYGVGHVTTSADCFGFGAKAGYYTDLETGLQAMAFRYYDAGAGRWLNRDPIRHVGGINLYAYVRNQPVDLRDPSGELPDWNVPFWVHLTWYWVKEAFYTACEVIHQNPRPVHPEPPRPPITAPRRTPPDSPEPAPGSGPEPPDAGSPPETGGGGYAGSGGGGYGGPGGGGGGGGGGACFTAGTAVLMADGTQKPIEAIRIGEQVAARDPATGAVVAAPVDFVWTHYADQTLSVHLDDGETLETTAGHPFLTADRGFVIAGRLDPGASIVTTGAIAARVTAIGASGHPRQRVYNLQVHRCHTYFVGRSHLCVHNISTDPNQLGELHEPE